MGTDHVFGKERCGEKRGLSPISAISATVLTGALGAGKTTLLNAALKGGAIRNAAVIVNEFGVVGIDNAIIESSGEDVVLLPGGCVCCEVRADLAEAVLRLERSAVRGESGGFERIVIETSGLAEPGPILQLFAESPMLAGRYRLEAVITVVDALLGAAALAEEGSAFRQALLADRLIVTKSESVPAQALDVLNARLAAINPYAEILHALRGEAQAAWFGPSAPASGRIVPASALRAAHDDSIESFVLQWEGAQPLASIGAWLQGLAETYGVRLLRVKGIVAAEGVETAVAVHVVQHIVGPPDFLSTRVLGSRVVFITRGLEPGDVAPAWPWVAASAAQPPARAASRLLPQPAAGGSFCAAVRP